MATRLLQDNEQATSHINHKYHLHNHNCHSRHIYNHINHYDSTLPYSKSRNDEKAETATQATL